MSSVISSHSFASNLKGQIETSEGEKREKEKGRSGEGERERERRSSGQKYTETVLKMSSGK